jgi:hypothetical protein
MDAGNIKFHRRASMALAELPSGDQAKVRASVASLAGIPVEEWSNGRLRRLPGPQPLYLLEVDDSLRVFLLATEGQPPEVVDVVRQETLNTFARAGA